MKLTKISTTVLAGFIMLAISHSVAHAAALTNNSQQNSTTNNTQTITVNPGDNLSQLATTYNTTMLRLFYANLIIVDPNLIYPGEKLVVPSSSQVLTPRPLPEEDANTTTPSNDTVPATTSSNVALPQVATSNNVWDELANCESSGNWSINSGNGYYGGLQFTLSSWESVGGVGYPNQATPDQQIAAAQLLLNSQGWGAWPVCSAKLGL